MGAFAHLSLSIPLRRGLYANHDVFRPGCVQCSLRGFPHLELGRAKRRGRVHEGCLTGRVQAPHGFRELASERLLRQIKGVGSRKEIREVVKSSNRLASWSTYGATSVLTVFRAMSLAEVPIGNCRRKVVPWPRPLMTWISPPWSLIMP